MGKMMEEIIKDIEDYTGEPLDRLVAVGGRVMAKLVPLFDQYNDLECQRIVRLGDLVSQLVASKVPESIIRDLVFPRTNEVLLPLVELLVQYLPLIYQEVFPAEEPAALAVTVNHRGKNFVVHVREDATIGDLLETMRECRHDSPVLEESELSSARIVNANGKNYPLETKIVSLPPDASFFLG